MSTQHPVSERPTYTLGSKEERSVGGLGLLELGTLIAFLAVGLLTMATQRTPAGLGGALLLMLVGGFAAFAPIAGRSPAQWVVIAARWWVVRARGLTLWHRSPSTVMRRGSLAQLVDLPGELGRLELYEVHDARGASVGVFRDKKSSTYSATLLVRGTRNWTLEGESEQADIASAFGGVLVRSAKDRSALHRVAWVERTLPEAPGALVRDLHENMDDGVSYDDSRARSYLELLEGAGRQADQHELLVTVQVRAAGARRQAKRRGWSAKEAPFLVLMDELSTFAGELENAEMEIRMALSPEGYLAAVRTGLDPWGQVAMDQANAAPAGSADESQIAPNAREAHWNRVVIDGSQHAVLWVEAWPGTRVGPGFLDDLLVDTNGAVRSVAVVMELKGPRAGRRKAQLDVTAAETAQLTRDSMGRRTTSQHAKSAAARYQHEDELADGHADTRFVGFVGVSAPGDNPADLEAEVDRVAMQASRCGLRLERLYGAQAEALTFTLPLGRGLR